MRKTIVIDAGHGTDSTRGVMAMREFAFNSAVAGHAQRLATVNNLRVVLTQPLNAKSVSLLDRTNLAIKEEADLIFSIHADASNRPEPNGFWVFHWYSDAAAKKLAEIWIKYANTIMRIHNRGIWECTPDGWPNFHMVRIPATNSVRKIPAILMEHGFMTNRTDLALLMNDNYRMRCAEVLIRTACEYFGQVFIPLNQPKPGRTHVVVRGETLTSIARRYRVTVPGILKVNPRITNPNNIRVGQIINIPSPVVRQDTQLDTPMNDDNFVFDRIVDTLGNQPVSLHSDTEDTYPPVLDPLEYGTIMHDIDKLQVEMDLIEKKIKKLLTKINTFNNLD